MTEATIDTNLEYRYSSNSVINVHKTSDNVIIDNLMLNQTSDTNFNAYDLPCTTDSSNVDHNQDGSDNSCNEICDGRGDINSMKLCSNCLNHFDSKIEESFENDTCGHILCLKCRFVQDNVCRLCKIKQQEEWQSSVALDLTTSFSSNLNNNVDSCNGNANNNDVSKKSKKPRNFVLPDYITVLPSDPPEYQCSICKRKFRYKLQSKYHETCFTGQRPLKCDICDKTFIKKCHLEYHLRTHSGDKPFMCSICDKRFIQKNKLTRHLKTHTGEMAFKCEKCGKCFASKQRMDTHKLKHTNERPFPCRSCRRTFWDKVTLKNHEMRHSAKTFICEECGKKFTLHWNLILHRRRHSGYKPYACDFIGCTVRFVCRRDLIRHMQTHSDLEYDYECSICTTAFRRKDNLERHMKNAHPESMFLGNQRQIVSIVKVKDLPFGTNDDKTQKLPKCQNVSVISSPKSSSNDVKKLSEIIEPSTENTFKKPAALTPHRLITPPVRSLTDGSNCVPTITKVTHIVHTSDTGVSNIKTVITTRDVPGKTKGDKSKQNKTVYNVSNEANKNELNSGVIRYVPKSSKSRTVLKNKFYRVIGQSSNSSIIMSCNTKKNNNNSDMNNLCTDAESFNSNQDDTVLSETSLSIRNIPYDNDNFNNDVNNCDEEFVTNYNSYLINQNRSKHTENLENDFIDSYNSNVNNNFRSNSYSVNSFDQFKNDDFYTTNRINYVPPSSNIFNSSSYIQSYGNVSESCLLADNALDESITAPLYNENDNNNNNSSNDINGYCN